MRMLPNRSMRMQRMRRRNRKSKGMRFAHDVDMMERQKTAPPSAEEPTHSVRTRGDASVTLG